MTPTRTPSGTAAATGAATVTPSGTSGAATVTLSGTSGAATVTPSGTSGAATVTPSGTSGATTATASPTASPPVDQCGVRLCSDRGVCTVFNATSLVKQSSGALQSIGLSSTAVSAVAYSSVDAITACECDGGVFGPACGVTTGSSSCFNSQVDNDEADVDCGGSCSAKCPEGGLCTSAVDCAAFTQCLSGRCASGAAMDAPSQYALVVPVWLLGSGLAGNVASRLGTSLKSVLTAMVDADTGTAHVLASTVHSLSPGFIRRQLQSSTALSALELQVALQWDALSGAPAAAAVTGYGSAREMGNSSSASVLHRSALGSVPGVMLAAVVADASNARVVSLDGLPLGALLADPTAGQDLPRPSPSPSPGPGAGAGAGNSPAAEGASSGSLTPGAIAGIVVAIAVVAIAALLVHRWRQVRGSGLYSRRRSSTGRLGRSRSRSRSGSQGIQINQINPARASIVERMAARGVGSPAFGEAAAPKSHAAPGDSVARSILEASVLNDKGDALPPRSARSHTQLHKRAAVMAAGSSNPAFSAERITSSLASQPQLPFSSDEKKNSSAPMSIAARRAAARAAAARALPAITEAAGEAKKAQRQRASHETEGPVKRAVVQAVPPPPQTPPPVGVPINNRPLTRARPPLLPELPPPPAGGGDLDRVRYPSLSGRSTVERSNPMHSSAQRRGSADSRRAAAVALMHSLGGGGTGQGVMRSSAAPQRATRAAKPPSIVRPRPPTADED